MAADLEEPPNNSSITWLVKLNKKIYSEQTLPLQARFFILSKVFSF
jgi:hypothetical protein